VPHPRPAGALHAPLRARPNGPLTPAVDPAGAGPQQKRGHALSELALLLAGLVPLFATAGGVNRPITWPDLVGPRHCYAPLFVSPARRAVWRETHAEAGSAPHAAVTGREPRAAGTRIRAPAVGRSCASRARTPWRRG